MPIELSPRPPARPGTPSEAALAWAAASLRERLSARTPGAAAGPSFDGAGRLAAFCQAGARGDEAAFQRRLAWEGLDAQALTAALGDGEAGALAAEWTDRLPRLAASAQRWAAALAVQPDAAVAPDPAREPPFLELWQPFLDVAREALAEQAGAALAELPVEPRRALEAQLLAELAGCGGLALYERFDAFRRERGAAGAYAAFVAATLEAGLAGLWAAYPLLARQLVGLVDDWARAQGELAARLRADRPRLTRELASGRELGALVAVQPALSDRHDGGRRVVGLGFASGLHVVYKPRSLALEAAFQELLAWLAARGLEPAPPAVRVLACDGYGWMESVAAEPLASVEEARAYFRRAGALVCVAHVLRGHDLHMDNVVATRRGPVLVDAEALLRPVEAREPAAVAADEPVAERVARSCLATGLVSFVQADGRGEACEIGGLMGRGGHLAALPRRVWRGLRSDALAPLDEPLRAPALANRVLLDGIVQAPSAWAEELCQGFVSAYRMLLAARGELAAAGGPLARFAGAPVRVVFRPTGHYVALLRLLAAPRYQRRGVERDIALETLNRVFQHERARPALWPLVADERAALERLDVPRFALAADATAPLSAAGEAAAGHFVRSGLAAARARLESLSEEDLAEELEILAGALAGEAADADAVVASVAAVAGPVAAEQAEPELPEPARLEARALAIAEELRARARRAPDGALTWLATRHAAAGGAAALAPLALYDGAAGVAVFFAAVARATGDAGWVAAARGTLAPLAPRLAEIGAAGGRVPIGGTSGVASVVYALALVGRLLGDEQALDLAGHVAQALTPERLAEDAVLDVAGGVAGAVLALVALHAERPDVALLARAHAGARHLLARERATGPGRGGWPAPDGLVHTGFAHGAGGVGCALARLAPLVGDERLLVAARRAFAHERAARGEGPLWPALVADPTGGAPRTVPMVAWCHGAPGVALARALAPQCEDDALLREDLETAARVTAGGGPGRFDHVCCGDLGRADVLLTAGTRFARSDWLAAGRALAAATLARAERAGRFSLPAPAFAARAGRPGFFQGLSGVGYALLRWAAPDRLPSVPGLEV